VLDLSTDNYIDTTTEIEVTTTDDRHARVIVFIDDDTKNTDIN
jgi:hypothetical protein